MALLARIEPKRGHVTSTHAPNTVLSVRLVHGRCALSHAALERSRVAVLFYSTPCMADTLVHTLKKAVIATLTRVPSTVWSRPSVLGLPAPSRAELVHSRAADPSRRLPPTAATLARTLKRRAPAIRIRVPDTAPSQHSAPGPHALYRVVAGRSHAVALSPLWLPMAAMFALTLMRHAAVTQLAALSTVGTRRLQKRTGLRVLGHAAVDLNHATAQL